MSPPTLGLTLPTLRTDKAAALSPAPPPTQPLGSLTSRSAPTPMTRAAAAKISKLAHESPARLAAAATLKAFRFEARVAEGMSFVESIRADRGFVDLRGAPDAFMYLRATQHNPYQLSVVECVSPRVAAARARCRRTRTRSPHHT